MTNPQFTASASAPRYVLRRRSTDRLLGGVCGGIADQLGIDVGLLRLLAVVFTILGGVTIPLYLAAWLLIPAQGQESSIAERLLSR